MSSMPGGPGGWDATLPSGPPVCPRHTDRESYVRCQRCQRPVCPECQRQAPVGVQCVDCVREAARGMRQTRTAFGGQAVSTPLATYVIVGICLLVYLAQLARPKTTTDLMYVPILGWSEPWRVLTGAFLHSPAMYLHIVMNMLALWQIGPYLESLLGRLRFVVLYLGSAIGGSMMVTLLANPPRTVPVPLAELEQWRTGVVGASGAVFGLFAAILVLNRHLGRQTAGIGLVVLVNGVFGFLYPGISWQGHLGGFLVGAALAGAFAVTAPRERRRWQWYAVAGVLLVTVGVLVLTFLSVPSLYR
ncbi:MAG TPA: rhomboid family intramembrane serine protease [Dermatophilaceae bacterium]|nr:rhomboid family intramembrane serine protease [Dermatophilaceae bacterium]